MKVLTLPKTAFHAIAYLDPHRLVTVSSDGRQSNPYHLWSLVPEAHPQLVDVSRRRSVALLFKPHGGDFLRRNGLWPDRAELPSDSLPGTTARHPALVLPNQWREVAFGPGGGAVLYVEYLPFNSSLRVRFHLRTSPDETNRLYLGGTVVPPKGAFSPDGETVAASNGFRAVAAWCTRTHRQTCLVEQTDTVQGVVFTTADRLAVAGGRTVRVWDVVNGKPVRQWPAFKKYVGALAVSHDGRLLAAGSGDGTIRLWDVTSGDEVARYAWGVGAIRHVAFSPDGTTAAAAGKQGVVVWDLG